MMRPVLNLATNTHELIGSFEQVSGRYTSLLALCIVWSVCAVCVGVYVDWFGFLDYRCTWTLTQSREDKKTKNQAVFI